VDFGLCNERHGIGKGMTMAEKRVCFVCDGCKGVITNPGGGFVLRGSLFAGDGQGVIFGGKGEGDVLLETALCRTCFRVALFPEEICS